MTRISSAFKGAALGAGAGLILESVTFGQIIGPNGSNETINTFKGLEHLLFAAPMMALGGAIGFTAGLLTDCFSSEKAGHAAKKAKAVAEAKLVHQE